MKFETKKEQVYRIEGSYVNQEPWREINRIINDNTKGQYKIVFYNIEDCNKMPTTLKFVAFDWENLKVLVFREPELKIFYMRSYNEVIHNLRLNEKRFLEEGLKINEETDYKRLFLFKDLEKQRIRELKKGDKVIKVGDYLATCWGYDQTNVEMFIIKKIIGNNYLIIQEIAQTLGSESGTVVYNNMKIDNRILKVDIPIKAYVSNEGYMSVCEHGYKRGLHLTELNKEHSVTDGQFGH